MMRDHPGPTTGPDAKKMRVAIVGSREFNDYEVLKKFVLARISVAEIGWIISGGARGADSLAERFAAEFHLNLRVFHPDWKRQGRTAGPLRNTLIVREADVVFAFPTIESTGTYDTIRKARDKGVPVHVCDLYLKKNRAPKGD